MGPQLNHPNFFFLRASRDLDLDSVRFWLPDSTRWEEKIAEKATLKVLKELGTPEDLERYWLQVCLKVTRKHFERKGFFRQLTRAKLGTEIGIQHQVNPQQIQIV